MKSCIYLNTAFFSKSPVRGPWECAPLTVGGSLRQFALHDTVAG
jgi:hypothetical protein